MCVLTFVRKESLRTYARSYARYRAYVRTLQTHDIRHAIGPSGFIVFQWAANEVHWTDNDGNSWNCGKICMKMQKIAVGKEI